CGIDLRDGICPLCNSRNSCVHDSDPNSFDYPPDSYHPPYPTYETYSGDSCGNDSKFGYDCPPQFSLNYEPEPGYTQNYNSCPHDSPIFPQQYPRCDDCGVTHEPYQCQPMNEDYYHEQNFCCDSNSFGFDDCSWNQATLKTIILIHMTHRVFHNNILVVKIVRIFLKPTIITIAQNKLMEKLTSMCAMVGQLIQMKQEEKQIEEEQAANARYWKIPAYSDDDDDSAITPNEPIDSLSMGDEHLNTIPATEADEFMKSCVKNLVLNPSESKGKSECDMPAREEFTTFSNILFNADYEF
nr:hypothetical protein [Tanacetum cinerariifolium]